MYPFSILSSSVRAYASWPWCAIAGHPIRTPPPAARPTHAHLRAGSRPGVRTSAPVARFTGFSPAGRDIGDAIA
jgi:hypothetical protein